MSKQEFFNKWFEIIKKSSAAQTQKQEFLDKWYEIIRKSPGKNTYKMAWAKAITEIACEKNEHNENGEVEIAIETISYKIIKYYWNQTIFFNLIQGSNPNKPPEIVAWVKELIAAFQLISQTRQPIRFERAYPTELCPEQFQNCLRKTSEVLKNEVGRKFIVVEGSCLDGIYEYQKGADTLYLPALQESALKFNKLLVNEAINYRWAQILETYNTCPRINKKVRIIDEEKVRKKPLLSFRKYLDLDNPGQVCFMCGQEISDSELAIEHVIPWTYLYSDDLWNLAYMHKTCVPANPHAVPEELSIARLQKRNKSLINLLANYDQNDKHIAGLKYAVEHNLARKFWATLKG